MEVARQSLISGEAAWQHFEGSDIKDWATPAVGFCRALEFELKRRLYDPQLMEHHIPSTRFTLGTIPYADLHRYKDEKTKKNWDLFVALVIRSKSNVDEFEEKVEWMHRDEISEKRNALAHGAPVSQTTASVLHKFILGDRETVGMLPWLAKHVEPVSTESH